MPDPLVLVVDEEAPVRRALSDALRRDGFAVATAACGHDALAAVARRPPEAIVLDVAMPGLDGVGFLRRLRAGGHGVAVCMLSRGDDVPDCLAGLQAGADDYLVKPVAPAELAARLRALLQRGEGGDADALVAADIVVDPGRRTAARAGRDLDLTGRELELLEAFVRHPGQALSRDQLLHMVWGGSPCLDSNVVDVFVGYLRRKLEAGGEPRVLHTVRGVGWALRR